jgi:hypothetical protein
MIAFDSSKIKTQILFIKQVSTAAGGSMLVLDHPEQDIKTARRISLPTSVARTYMEKLHSGSYMKSVPTAVVWYDNSVIDLEPHPLKSHGIELKNPSGVDFWLPHTFGVAEDELPKLTATGDWFFDGRYAYRFASSLDFVVGIASSVSKSGSFRVVPVQTIDLHSLHTDRKLAVEVRECVAFVTADGQYGVTPPIWKSAQIITKSIYRKGHTDVEDTNVELDEKDDDVLYLDLGTENPNKYWVDKIDNDANVSLGFALYAGTRLGKVFDYEHIDALKLPELMIQLRSVNMPNIDQSIRSTFGIGLTFSQALAWLIGMLSEQLTHTQYFTVLSCIKYLCKQGVFKKTLLTTAFLSDNVEVPVMSLSSFKLK